MRCVPSDVGPPYIGILVPQMRRAGLGSLCVGLKNMDDTVSDVADR